VERRAAFHREARPRVRLGAGTAGRPALRPESDRAPAGSARGDLDRVVRCIRIAGYVNSTADFTAQSQVVNGASDLVVDVFGEAGRHTRMAVGVSALPYDVAVEVEAVFEVR
jgi:enamine deaminase RidA (YjgF/YER057c/UK114 family)